MSFLMYTKIRIRIPFIVDEQEREQEIYVPITMEVGYDKYDTLMPRSYRSGDCFRHQLCSHWAVGFNLSAQHCDKHVI